MRPMDDDNVSSRNLINRGKELTLIQHALDALRSNNNTPLNTPIINFFGIDGIGKTRILQEISARCRGNDLLCLELDGSQTTTNISRAILLQTKKYRQRSPQQNTPKKRDSQSQTVNAIKSTLNSTPVVILFDSIDASNNTLINWIKITFSDIFHALMEHNNLFIVLMSKQQVIFEDDWFMTRKLTPFPLKPLDHNNSRFYLDSLVETRQLPLSPQESNRSDSSSYRDALDENTSKFILQWTRGYPLAMEVMTKAIFQQHFDIEQTVDQQQLITLIIEEVIDKKVLAHVEPSLLDWYKAHYLLLSIPRRFNLIIMQELLETFGYPLIEKLQSKLEYIGLPKRLSPNIEILRWDTQKAGYTLDASIRNILLIYQQIYNNSLFINVNLYLVNRNWEIAQEVFGSGSDCIRYFLEYLYHSALCSDTRTAETNSETMLHKLSEASLDVRMQFYQKFVYDTELLEVLAKHHPSVLRLIHKHFHHKEE